MEGDDVMSTITHEVVEPFYAAWQANAVRIRMPLTMIFIAPYTNQKMAKLSPVLQKKLIAFIKKSSRKTDIVFEVTTDGRIGVLLTQSTSEEANHFLKRLSALAVHEEVWQTFQQQHVTFKASVTEIRTDEYSMQHILASSYMALYQIAAEQMVVEITTYRQPKLEKVKISIIEDDGLMRNIIATTIRKMPTPDYMKEVALFTDGDAFLQSDFYYSAHKHIVIMNDVLPKKTGLDVLHSIREMANERKFIIYMMTNRNAEEAMIDAYEKGVDVYLIKPFNLRLFEAQLQRTFRSLWL